MIRKRMLVIVIICTALMGWCTNGYTFGLRKPKADSVKLYDKAHDSYLKGKYKEAEKGYQEFMKKHPDSLLIETALYYTARCYTEDKNYNQAISYYKQLLIKYKKGFWVDSAKEEIVKIQAIQKGK